MIDSKEVKKILTSLGADLCGIASIDSFGFLYRDGETRSGMCTCTGQ